jgi:hypothetical protein
VCWVFVGCSVGLLGVLGVALDMVYLYIHTLLLLLLHTETKKEDPPVFKNQHTKIDTKNQLPRQPNIGLALHFFLFWVSEV